MVYISKSAKIGRDCKFGENIFIDDGVYLGDGVIIGHNCVIYKNTKIGDLTRILDNSVIGRPVISAKISSRKPKLGASLCIGTECIIGSCVVLYHGTNIGNYILIGDLASVRENCKIGDFSIIGRGVLVEYDTQIGKKVKIQTGSHITGNMIIEDEVFIGPHVVTANDKYMDRKKGIVYQGPHIKRNARIGANSTLMPGITIGIDAIVAAGAFVTRNIPDGMLAYGNPAKILKQITLDKK